MKRTLTFLSAAIFAGAIAIPAFAQVDTQVYSGVGATAAAQADMANHDTSEAFPTANPNPDTVARPETSHFARSATKRTTTTAGPGGTAVNQEEHKSAQSSVGNGMAAQESRKSVEKRRSTTTTTAPSAGVGADTDVNVGVR